MSFPSLLCPDSVVVQLILEINEIKLGIILSNLDSPMQLSLLYKAFSNQLHFSYCSAKLPNQCIFAIHCKGMHIVIHIKYIFG